MRKSTIVLTVFLATVCAAPMTRGITPTSANQPNGKTAQQLALQVIDSSAGIVLDPGTASFDIDNFGTLVASDPKSVGHFTNGITPAGTLLPTNQNQSGDAGYAGGIGIPEGVCLCTGLLTDEEDSITPDPMNPEKARGAGLEGPNNGNGGGSANDGEMNTALDTPRDKDFEMATGLVHGNSGDAAVLEFDITISAPAILRLSFIFGSDEVDAWLNQPFNDSFAALIESENIADITTNSPAFPNGQSTPFDLQEIEKCSLLFVHADVAPNPPALPASDHAQPGEPLYDVELGGFTILLARETCQVLPPGTYSVKLVIQDMVDKQVDSALFIPTGGLTAFNFLKGDADLNGFVGQGDLDAVLLNWGETGKCYTEGDLDGNGQVAQGDLDLVLLNWGNSGGNKNFCSDFNRDGVLDAQDYAIWDRYEGELTSCASRFEGDANGDGKVDSLDFDIFSQEVISGNPSGLCNNDCCGAQMVMAGGGGESAASSEALIAAHLGKLDIDEDQDFDGDDISLWKAKLGAAEK